MALNLLRPVSCCSYKAVAIMNDLSVHLAYCDFIPYRIYYKHTPNFHLITTLLNYSLPEYSYSFSFQNHYFDSLTVNFANGQPEQSSFIHQDSLLYIEVVILVRSVFQLYFIFREGCFHVIIFYLSPHQPNVKETFFGIPTNPGPHY